MFRSKGVLSPVAFLLLLTSVVSPKLVVSGSPDVTGGDRYRRPDPLRSFDFYNGGFDVRNKHYWFSTAFTGVHGYAIAAVWGICGLSFGLLLYLNNFRSDSSSSSPAMHHHLDRLYLPLLLLILLFTFLAIVATGLVIAANQSSRQRSQRLKDTIAKAGADTQKTIRDVINAMTEMQFLLLPYDNKTTQQLNVTTHQLRKQSLIVQRFVQKNGHSIDLAIETSYVMHLVVVSVNLAFLFLALVNLLLHWHPGFIIIIFFCWIITTLCWVLTGFDFFLHTFAEDTCSALGGFVQNPRNNSLSTMLPCMDKPQSDKILVGISSTIHSFISQLNMRISQAVHSVGLNEQSENSVGLGVICDPFHASNNQSYVPENCPNGAIPIGEFPYILARFTCYRNDTPATCQTNGKFIPEDSYRKAWAYSNSVQDMLNIFPDLQSLTQCQVVKGTFSDIVANQCRPFRSYLGRLWGSMLALSVFMVVLVLLWVAKAYQEKGESFPWCSVWPSNSQETGIRIENENV